MTCKEAAVHALLAKALYTGRALSLGSLTPTCGIVLPGKDKVRRPHALAGAEVSSSVS